ncbi:optineurin-like [Hetaerina americana]|uniref:optineurin-like n=1 Tax=Hetaerina americana TaxID=62018 RepID=UPI003A7F2CC8
MSQPGAIPQSLSPLEARSLQSEESFTVIARSPSNDVNFPEVRNGPMSAVDSNFSMESSTVSGLGASISLHGLSPDEIQNKLHALVEENNELKGALKQNNLAMKKQFDTLVTWQEEVFKVHQNHKQKFEETKELIVKLKTENADLRKVLVDLQSAQHSSPDIAKLQAENATLKRMMSEAEAKEKFVCLKEFQLKKEIADLKEQVEGLQKKLSQYEGGNATPGTPSKQQSNAIAAVKAEKEELGGNGTLPLTLTRPSGKEKPEETSFVMVDENLKKLPGRVEPWNQKAVEEMSRRQLAESQKVLEVERQTLEEDRKALEEVRKALERDRRALEEGKKSLEMAERAMREKSAGTSGMMIDSQRLPGNVELRNQRPAEEEVSRRHLEEYQKVLEVERQALEEDRKALEKNRRFMCDKLREAEELRKSAEAERVKLSMQLAEMMSYHEMKSGREPQGTDKPEAVQSYSDNDRHFAACKSHLDLIREYVLSQQQKSYMIEVLTQKLYQIIVSLAAVDPSMTKDLKEEIMEAKEKISNNADELRQQRDHIFKAEEFLAELKLGFDTIQAREASIASVTKEHSQADYYKAQAEGYQQKLDDVTARLTQAEGEIDESRRKCHVLLDKLRTAERDLEAVPILKTQVEVYETDFKTEREERERMATEKQKLEEEVHRLRARNQQLLDDMENMERVVAQETRSPPDGSAPPSAPSSGGVSPRVNAFNTLAAPGRSGRSAYDNQVPNRRGETLDRSARGSSEPEIFTCPKCFRAYMEIGPLEIHVNQCLDTP